MKAVIDNDILLKAACYNLLAEIIATVTPLDAPPGVLGAARFVVQSAIKKRLSPSSAKEASERFGAFLKGANALEPNEEEQELAAEIEYHAQIRNAALDAGESQLCAIAVVRAIPIVASGDKRAIAAIENILDHCPRLPELRQRLICLEQLLLRVLASRDANDLRDPICRESHVDKAVSNCFSCASASMPEGSCEEGLRSYVKDLRGKAARVLGPD